MSIGLSFSASGPRPGCDAFVARPTAAAEVLDEVFTQAAQARAALLEGLAVDVMSALPGAMPALSMVTRQGDDRPQDAEVMVDLGLVPGWLGGGVVFLRTDGRTLRVTHRILATDGGSIETDVVEAHGPLAVTCGWGSMARKLATMMPATGSALTRMLRDDVRDVTP